MTLRTNIHPSVVTLDNERRVVRASLSTYSRNQVVK